MSRRRDRRLTVAYIMATAVVVGVASVGSASALEGSNTVFSDDIVAGAVGSSDVKDGAVGAVDVRDGSLSGVEVADGGVAGVDVADGSIGSVDVTDGSIGSADVGSINGGDVADGTIGTADVSNGSIRGEDLNLFNDNHCTGETIQGTAAINADALVPTTFTTAWVGYQHSCTGEPVQVRRVNKGLYEVNFGSSPARLAVVSATQFGVIATVRHLTGGTFEVSVFAGSTSADGFDNDFSILVY